MTKINDKMLVDIYSLNRSELLYFINFLREETIRHQRTINNIKTKIKTTRLSTFQTKVYLWSIARHMFDIIKSEKEIDKCFFLLMQTKETGKSSKEEVIDVY